MLFCEARQCQRLGPGIFVCGSWAWRAEYPIQSYLESLLLPPSPHPLKQSKTLQYSAEYIWRSEYPFHSYLKPTASPAASQNTIIGSNPHRSTCSIVNTQTMVIWDHLHLQQTRWVEIISTSSSQPRQPQGSANQLTWFEHPEWSSNPYFSKDKFGIETCKSPNAKNRVSQKKFPREL